MHSNAAATRNGVNCGTMHILNTPRAQPASAAAEGLTGPHTTVDGGEHGRSTARHASTSPRRAVDMSRAVGVSDGQGFSCKSRARVVQDPIKTTSVVLPDLMWFFRATWFIHHLNLASNSASKARYAKLTFTSRVLLTQFIDTLKIINLPRPSVLVDELTRLPPCCRRQHCPSAASLRLAPGRIRGQLSVRCCGWARLARAGGDLCERARFNHSRSCQQ